MAYYFKYTAQGTIKEWMLPRSQDTVTIYYCFLGASENIKEYIVEYTGEEAICLATMRADTSMEEITASVYTDAVGNLNYTRTRGKEASSYLLTRLTT